MKKKTLVILIASVVTAAAMTVGGTLAFFTDTETATNTFTVGNVNITLDEAIVTRAEGSNEWIADEEERTEEGNTYDNIFPGAYLPKDPTVTVAKDSEDCYVRLKIEVKNWNRIKKLITSTDELEAKFDPEDFIEYDGNEYPWEVEDLNASLETGVFYLRYIGAVTPDGTNDVVLSAPFTAITIPYECTANDMEKFKNFSIKIEAQSIQAHGFVDSSEISAVDAAWAAFDAR